MEVGNLTIGFEGFPADESEKLYEASTGVVVFLSVCYGAISVLAVAGNSLVMWAVAGSRRMQRSATNWLLANLALADIVIGLFAAALIQRWELPEFMCAFCPFVQTLSVNVSVFTLTALAVRRYRAVARPLSEACVTRCQVRLTLLGIWALGGLLAAPMAVTLQVIQVEGSGGTTKPFCAFVGLGELALGWYRRLLVALQYFAPLCVISAVYARLAWLLWGAQPPGNAEDSRDARMLRKKKRVIKMLVVVVALFALCWLPLQTYNVLQDIFPGINDYRYINIIWFSCDWLAMSNSVCNPFVYGIYNEKFRRSFQSRCHLCRRLLKVPKHAAANGAGVNARPSSAEDSSSRHRVVTKLALQPRTQLNNSEKTCVPQQQVAAPGSEPQTPETLTSIVFCTTQPSTAL
ncbi:hypothetical protein B566_EDAN002193 [Ephemera danica]|nr:hypothetical protein B566_EDAN002193 [Ephemera danica]